MNSQISRTKGIAILILGFLCAAAFLSAGFYPEYMGYVIIGMVVITIILKDINVEEFFAGASFISLIVILAAIALAYCVYELLTFMQTVNLTKK